MKTAKIIRDQDCGSPREYDNLGTLCLFHSRYSLPNESEKTAAALQEFIGSEFNGLVLKVWGYDHGGLALSTEHSGCFADQWDSGQAGIIYIERSKIVEEFGTEWPDEKVLKCLQGEVEVFSKWLSGDCWGYVIEEGGEQVDSCWGFIGQGDAEEAAREAGAEEVRCDE